MYFNFMTDLETHLKDQFQAESITITADPCPAEFDGDITLNCFLQTAYEGRGLRIQGRSQKIIWGGGLI